MRLGVDVGGTKIEAALVDEKGKILKKVRKPTQVSKGKKVVINNILSAIKELDSKKIKNIGLSIAGVINPKGILSDSPNIKCLEGLNVSKILEKELKKRIYQENDANCFAIAEHKFGAGKGYKNVVGLIIGTGIGSGLILNNKLYEGSVGGSGEFGHMIIDGTNDFEKLCSGPNIVKRYKQLGGKLQTLFVQDIFASKEPIAKKISDETYKYFAIGIANIINIIDPEVIIIGGGLSNIPIYTRIKKEVKKYAIHEMGTHTKIIKNKLGADSGVIGAAFLRP